MRLPPRMMMNQGPRKNHSPASGLLLVDKPAGLSSFDVVARVRRAYGERKVGHTGTLDPMATGLLGILMGRATRLSPFLTVADKRYHALIELGFSTDTYDAEGQRTGEWPDDVVHGISMDQIEEQLAKFRGEIEQVPPAHSAIKVDGERAYARARRGEHVEMAARSVRIDELKLLSVEAKRLALDVACSKGTYIRSLAHDLGAALGIGATLVGLRRTHVGTWDIHQAVALESLEKGDDSFRLQALRPISDVVSHFPQIELNGEQIDHIRNGRRFSVSGVHQGRYRAHDEVQELIAVVDVDQDSTIRVVRGIPPAS
jgi:tRNA pseudouridine55 synthase